MSGDGDVAALSGQRCPGVVARPLSQVRGVRALDDDLVDADLGDPDVADGVPLGRRVGAGRVQGWPRRQSIQRRLLRQGVADELAVGLLSELRAQPGLGPRLLNGGAPDLIRREQEQHDAGPDQDPPDDVDDPAKR